MKRFRLRPTARADTYVRDLDAAFSRLAGNPLAGQACEEVKVGFRRLLVRSHAIFYRVDDDQVEIVRVLHQSMDALQPL